MKDILKKHEVEIRNMLEGYGSYDAKRLVSLVEKFRFSEFIGAYSMAINFEAYSSLLDGDDEITDAEATKAAKLAGEYAYSVAKEFRNQIDIAFLGKDYTKVIHLGALFKWFLEFTGSDVPMELGGSLLSITTSRFLDEEDKAGIISESGKDGTINEVLDGIRKLEEFANAISSEGLDIPEEIQKKLDEIRNDFEINDGDYQIKPSAIHNVFTKRHAALSKVVMDTPDDLFFGSFVSSKLRVVESLGVYFKFLQPYLDTDKEFWKRLGASVIANFDDDLSDLVTHALTNSKENFDFVTKTYAPYINELPEFAVDNWKEIFTELKDVIPQNIETFNKVGFLINLYCIGAASAEIAEKASLIVETSFARTLTDDKARIIATIFSQTLPS